MVIVPALVLLFHVDLRYAIGASLISVIATSSGAAVAYVREGFSNVRIGMFLEVATTLGARRRLSHCARFHSRHRHYLRHYPAVLCLELVSRQARSDDAYRLTRWPRSLKMKGTTRPQTAVKPILRRMCRRVWHHVHRREFSPACWASVPGRSRSWPWTTR